MDWGGLPISSYYVGVRVFNWLCSRLLRGQRAEKQDEDITVWGSGCLGLGFRAEV